MGAPRSVFLCFLIWVRDPFPGDLDAGAGSLGKIAQGKPGMATFSWCPLQKSRRQEHMAVTIAGHP